MGEGLRVAAQHHVDVVEVAVDADALGCHHEEVRGGGPLLLGAVARVGADVQLLAHLAEAIQLALAVGHVLPERADDGAQVLARGDHAPAADGVEPDRDGVVGEEGRPVVRAHLVGVLDPEGEVGLSVVGSSSVGPRPLVGGVFVGPQDPLGAEVA